MDLRNNLNNNKIKKYQANRQKYSKWICFENESFSRLMVKLIVRSLISPDICVSAYPEENMRMLHPAKNNARVRYTLFYMKPV